MHKEYSGICRDPCTLLGHWNPTYSPPSPPPPSAINKCLLKLGCFAKIAMKRYNWLFDKLPNCFGANGEDWLYFPFEMVLIWFDLSTRDGKVSHVLAHFIRRFARTIRPSHRFQRFNGCVCAIRFFLGELQWPYIGFIQKIALQQVSYSIFLFWFENFIITTGT